MSVLTVLAVAHAPPPAPPRAHPREGRLTEELDSKVQIPISHSHALNRHSEAES